MAVLHSTTIRFTSSGAISSRMDMAHSAAGRLYAQPACFLVDSVSVYHLTPISRVSSLKSIDSDTVAR
ncbi:Uncharacterised protein [Bordetella pertussis]|nr:Uncharacterised protein [Bordetella pertussis]CFW33697.1 Uncharacterised protein [Bordetella pertussis]CPK94722.1 Uncharacterised protein [Bordetella pertussis]CPL76318.1 Uncharacterised protein [Bordetella pertussis]CPM89060.1 Uncharacterised protein [Bordetella pertussis]